VLYGPREIHAFEIKRSHSVSPKDCKALLEFQKDYPTAKLYVLYGGTRREYYDDVTAVPFQELLADLPNLLS